jgi:hypothetical protein
MFGPDIADGHIKSPFDLEDVWPSSYSANTNEILWAAKFAAHVDTPVTPPNHLVAELSQPTSDAILIALAKEPAKRYQSYDDFIMAMTAARSQLLVNQFRGRGGGTNVLGWLRR